MMTAQRRSRVSFSTLFVFAACCLFGCGLTKAQLSATQAFAKAAKSYPNAPASVVTTYADVYLARSSIQASTYGGAGPIWN